MKPMHRTPEVKQQMKSNKNIYPTAAGPNSNYSIHIWSSMLKTLALTVLAGTLVACASGLASQGGPRIAQDRGKITGRALLIGDQAETTGYGLYSYVLFESPPTPETKSIYLAIISAYVKEVSDLGGLETKHRKESLNAMFIPVTGESTDSTVPQRPEDILQRYNYTRAQAILGQFSNAPRNDGPYLVSSLAPVSSGSKPSLSMYQDLSVVRQVASQDGQVKMAYEWMLDFVDRVSNPQSTAWNRDTLVKFGDEVRDARRLSFKRYGVSADKLDLKRYIVFPMDTNAERMLPFPTWKTMVSGSRPNPIMLLDQS